MRKIPPELSANTLAFSDDGLKAMQLGTYVLDVNLSLGVSGIFSQRLHGLSFNPNQVGSLRCDKEIERGGALQRLVDICNY